MSHFIIPNRPFATDMITGFMLPDGLFATMLGRQNLNVQIKNMGASASSGVSIYIESASHPEIRVFANTHAVASLQSQATTVVAWTVDLTNCPPGNHFVSVIVDEGGTKTRLIKKFFVLGVTFNADAGFVAEMPEGLMRVKFGQFVASRGRCCGSEDRQEPDHEPPRHDEDRGCCGTSNLKVASQKPLRSLASYLQNFKGHSPEFRACLPGYLIKTAEYSWEPTPAYKGQYSDLPFEDPWWKAVLAIIAVLLLIGAAIAEAVDGTGRIDVSVGGTLPDSESSGSCCAVAASGGGTSYVAAGLLAGAAAMAVIAGLSDKRDAFRIGQDHTQPNDDETTLSENFFVEFRYPESVALGRPIAVEADWKYQRHTDAKSYSHGQRDVANNIHVVSEYEVSAPEIAERQNPNKPWIIRAKFKDGNGALFKGEQLFVQCFMIAPSGAWHRYVLQDDGIWPDETASSGSYATHVDFRRIKAETGDWHYFVIAQDVNHAQPDMKPEDAAQIIGGMVLTHQLTLSFTEDECPIIPDGYVRVV